MPNSNEVVQSRRRAGDSESHAHKRDNDEFARLHNRIDDNTKRLDDHDDLLNHFMQARFESIRLHNETTTSIKTLTEAVQELTRGTEGLREVEDDVRGMMRMMSRMNGFIGLLWKPMLFFGVAGGTIYLWLKGIAIGGGR